MNEFMHRVSTMASTPSFVLFFLILFFSCFLNIPFFLLDSSSSSSSSSLFYISFYLVCIIFVVLFSFFCLVCSSTFEIRRKRHKTKITRTIDKHNKQTKKFQIKIRNQIISKNKQTKKKDYFTKQFAVIHIIAIKKKTKKKQSPSNDSRN